MAGRKGMITSEDLASIRSCNQFLGSIELLAPEQGETLRDHRPRWICLNDYMFKAEVCVPIEYDIVELLYVFSLTPIHIAPNSWKIIQAVVWFCEWGKCHTDCYLRRSLLSRNLMQGHVTFSGKQNTKIVDNLPDLVPEWKMRFFYSWFKEAGGGSPLAGASLKGGERGCWMLRRRHQRAGNEPKDDTRVLPIARGEGLMTECGLIIFGRSRAID
ncbi:hypothetical protein ACLOJK_019150 [Asimina triloba]